MRIGNFFLAAAILFAGLPQETHAEQILCGDPMPQPSEWTDCTLDGIQNRVVYRCNQNIGTYQADIESQACEPEFVRLSLTDIGLAVLLLLAGAAGLFVWKKRTDTRPRNRTRVS